MTVTLLHGVSERALRPADLIVFVLLGEGHNTEEIAQATGKTSAWVLKSKQRSREYLHSSLEGYEQELGGFEE